MSAAIKAIETHYKGYRFRSRLEARWAVFFDALGVKWEYEKEGYEIDGIRYLPDFYVHGSQQKIFFEIKPYEARSPFTSIYLAGKIRSEIDWRDEVIKTLREKSERYELVGPFYISHDDNDDDIVRDCLWQIDSSNVVFANFVTDDTPGTLIELGYARAKDKRIVIRFETEELCDRLWFARELTQEYKVGGNIPDQLVNLLPSLSTTFDKCRKLSNVEKVILLQGDPMNAFATVFSYGGEIDWGNNIKRLCEIWLTSNGYDEAAKSARSARFEYGEKGL